MHRRNAAERAIRTFKAHFLAGLATCDPEFPISEWDRLLEQAEMTLNMLRTARCHPKLSSYAYIHGNHDFNKTPLAPPGTRVVIHKKPGVRNTWGFHGERAWYIGPAINHYRCYKCLVPSTSKEVITDTVKFIPKKIPFPQLHFNTYLQLAIEKIIKLLEQNVQTNHSLKRRNEYDLLHSFKQVAKAVNNGPTLPPAPSPRVQTNLQHMPAMLKSKDIMQYPTNMSTSPRVNFKPKLPMPSPHLPVRAFLSK